jgi:hypothetical protein
VLYEIYLLYVSNTDVHLPKINSFVSLHILTIKAKVQNTKLYITIIPSFQELGFIFVRVVNLETHRKDNYVIDG